MIDFIVNNIRWHVIQVPPTHPMLLNDAGNFTLGCCNNNYKTIYIAQGLGWEKFKKVLCHEITHAAMYSYQIWLTEDQEELIADILSTYGDEVITVTNRVFKKIRNLL